MPDDASIMNGKVVEGTPGDDWLQGTAGADTVNGGDGMDWMVYAGSDAAVMVDISAGGSASGGHAEGDVLMSIENVYGSEHNDVFTGSFGDNKFVGGGGDDEVMAGDGADVARGGMGNDDLRGEGGNDTLYGDMGADRVDGGAGDDMLHGGKGDDMLYGGMGDDLLTGGMGADEIDGGAGMDMARYYGSSEGVTVNLNTGSASGGHAEGDSFTSIEGVIGSMMGDHLTLGPDDGKLLGYAGDDTLLGGSGDDVLGGGKGDDLLDAGSGSNTLRGGFGGDTFQFWSNESWKSTNKITDFTSGQDIIAFNDKKLTAEELDSIINSETRVAGGFEYTLGNATIMTSVALGREDFYAESQPGRPPVDRTQFNLTNGNDDWPGAGVDNSGDDHVRAYKGNDTVMGGAGSDLLDGGEGKDQLHGEAGQDVLHGGTGNDTLHGGTADATQTNNEADDFTGSVTGATDAADDLFGGAGNDVAYGGAGADLVDGGTGNDTLYGNAGNDQIMGGAGNDSVQGGDGRDLITGGAGRDTINGDGGNDDIDGGADGDTITGEEGNDILSGGAGDDSITGGVGHDTLDGGMGIDTLTGGGGNDILKATKGDIIDGEGDVDTVDYSNESASLTVDFADNTTAGNEDVSNIENATGGSGDDKITGSDAANTIKGGAGDDELSGGTGNDTLDGGAGMDELTGGAGADTFAWSNGDTITDYDATTANGIDVIDVKNPTSAKENATFSFYDDDDVDTNPDGVKVTVSGESMYFELDATTINGMQEASDFADDIVWG